MSELIKLILEKIRHEENVKIIYACEAGSRAWGFASPKSDYDIRFIYYHPLEWYLSIDDREDTIKRPISDNLDIHGWDLRKTLNLLRKSNPNLLEWLGSPIVYESNDRIFRELRHLAHRYYTPSACLYHYTGLARNHYRDYLQTKEVELKKYFYILRPVLAVKWITENKGIVPTYFPDLFRKLELSESLKIAIETLLEKKISGDKLGKGDKIEIIDDFILNEINSWMENPRISGTVPKTDIKKLNEFFYQTILEI